MVRPQLAIPDDALGRERDHAVQPAVLAALLNAFGEVDEQVGVAGAAFRQGLDVDRPGAAALRQDEDGVRLSSSGAEAVVGAPCMYGASVR